LFKFHRPLKNLTYFKRPIKTLFAAFSRTKCHNAHKTGTHIHFYLAACLPADPNYDSGKKKICSKLCAIMIAFGARRILFNDSEAKAIVNKWASDNKFIGQVDDSVPGHDNHFHAELSL
jgi:hypothetical protein